MEMRDVSREMTEGRGADRTIEANGFKPTFARLSMRSDPGAMYLIGVFEKPQELAMNTYGLRTLPSALPVNANWIPELIKLIQAEINTNS